MGHNTEFKEMKLFTDDWWCPSPCLIRTINAGDGIGGWIIAFHSAFINMSDWNVGYCIIGIMSDGCDSYITRWENLWVPHEYLQWLLAHSSLSSAIHRSYNRRLMLRLRSQKICSDARVGIPIAITTLSQPSANNGRGCIFISLHSHTIDLIAGKMSIWHCSRSRFIIMFSYTRIDEM